MDHGGSDTSFSVKDTTDYYDALDATNGGSAAKFVRLFVVPGMNHCTGGPATDQFDTLTPLIDWVEKGVAPDSIVATASNRVTSTSLAYLAAVPVPKADPLQLFGRHQHREQLHLSMRIEMRLLIVVVPWCRRSPARCPRRRSHRAPTIRPSRSEWSSPFRPAAAPMR